MKAKKINEFQTKKQLYPNKNLFKDTDYELKKDMEFEDKNEINCQKILFFRGISIIILYVIYKFIFLLYCLYHFNETMQYNFFRIPLLILIILLFIIFKDVKRIINNTTSLRYLIFMIHSFDLFLFCKSIPDDDLPDLNNIDEINCFFTLSMFINSYIIIIILNYVFLLGYKKSIMYCLINNLNLLCFYGHKNCNLFKRLFLNIFSDRFLVTIFYTFLILFIQNIINKPTKKLWAMFDSFKKSYLSVRNIFNNISLPVMIVKDDLSEIVYQNQAAMQFCRKYRRAAQKGEYSFKDIFFLDIPEASQYFKDILQTTLDNKITYFLFPFLLEDAEKKQNKELPFLMNLDPNSTEENSCFIKFYCFPCKWKEKTPCYYFIINENIFTFQGGQVILNNFTQIQNELEKIMWNINTLCLNIDRKLNYNNTKENLFFFYINLSVNFIYDLTTTNYIYNTFIEKKKLSELSKFNLENLVKYMSNYLIVFGINKNFNIDIKIDRKEDVICNLAYIRAIIFNILLFIIENSNDQKPKTITIKREHIKYEYKKGNYDKLIFSFTDTRPQLSYDTLKFFFQHFNYHFFLRRNPIETYNLVNFGFLVPSLISETQYNLNDNKIKQFKIDTKGYNVEVSIILFFQEVPNLADEPNNIIEEKKFNVFEKSEMTNEIKTILAKRFYKRKENIQQESLLDDGKDDNLIKANEEYNLAEDKNLATELRAKKYVIGEHHFEDIIPDKQKYNVFSNKKVKFKSSLAKKKLRVEPLLKSINFNIIQFNKFEIPRFLVIEEKSSNDNSIFNFILKSGNECNIDLANDGTILFEKYNEIFKQKMLFDYIFIDICQSSLKGYDALVIIRDNENKIGIHTKIIGIQNKINDKTMINKKMNLELFDKVIEKTIKDFNELIYG